MTDDIYVLNEPMRELVGIDRLIHEPARLVICAILYAVKNADFLYLLNQTGLTRGNLSSHLSKLEKHEYIVIEKTYSGKIPRTICQMTDVGREAFTIYRENLKQVAQSLPE